MKSSLMTYKQIKWLILLIPTITVGLWEYFRHTPPMLERLSMEAGNWLTPVIVFAVTMLFERKLFELLEDTHNKLEEEKAHKIMLEEREKIARELHDGIAQSLFLLSVNMNQWEAKEPQLKVQEQYQKVRKTVQHMHDDVRQSIFNLRHPTIIHPFPWTESLQQLVDKFQQETGVNVLFQWAIPEQALLAKEKVELYACVKEALMNIRKHTQAQQVLIVGQAVEDGWLCRVEDDGGGFKLEELADHEGYGLEIMQDRAREMGWKIDFKPTKAGTLIEIRKEV